MTELRKYAMTELEELRAQKKQLEARINELLRGETRTGSVKLEYYTSASYGLRWRVAVLNDEVKGLTWHTALNGTTRNAVVGKLPKLIADLQALYEAVKGGEADGQRTGD